MKWCNKSLLKSPIPYGLCLCPDDFAAVLRTLKHEPVPFLGKQSLAETHKLEIGRKIRVVVCLDTKGHSTQDKALSTLIHESVHVWQAIRAYIGEGDPAVEQEAYCIEQIASNLMTEYRKATNIARKV